LPLGCPQSDNAPGLPGGNFIDPVCFQRNT
jgi:hypothetical protein